MKNLSKLCIVLALTVWGLNTANAQQSLQDDEAIRAAEVKSLVNKKDYVFEASHADSKKGGESLKNHKFFVALANDTLIVCLPSKSGKLVKFDYSKPKYEYIKSDEDDGAMHVIIKPVANTTDVKELRLNINSEGQASLNVIRKNHGPLSFEGYIKQEDY